MEKRLTWLFLFLLTISTSNACILINASGSYQLSSNVTGSPYSASPLAGKTCVKITVSNVDFSCDGHKMTSNESSSIGILLNGTLTNVTVRDCPNINSYTHGVVVYDSDRNLIRNITTQDDVLQGLWMIDSNNNTIISFTALNLTNGMLLNNSKDNNITDSTAYDNTNGFNIASGSTGNRLERCLSYNHAKSYIITERSTLVNNTGRDSSQAFYITGNRTLFERNKAHSNVQGAWIESSHNRIINNTIYWNTECFYLRKGTNNTIRDNQAYGAVDGFKINATDSQIENNIARDNTNGFNILNRGNTLKDNQAFRDSGGGYRVYKTASITLEDNSANGDGNGYLVIDSNGTSITRATSYGNTNCGINLQNSPANITGTILYQNDIADLCVENSGSLNVTDITFDKDGAKNAETVLNIIDMVEANTGYRINWTEPKNISNNYITFRDKTISIVNTTENVSIDHIEFTWTQSEVSGYKESKFGLWKYNGTWIEVNGTPDTTNNKLSLQNLDPQSDYGILQPRQPSARKPGGGSASGWYSTQNITEEGYSEGDSFNGIHVIEITAETARLRVNGKEVEVMIGVIKRMDLDDDGFEETEILVRKITDKSIDVEIRALTKPDPSEDQTVQETTHSAPERKQEQIFKEERIPTKQKKKGAAPIIVMVMTLAISLGLAYYFVQKK